MEAKIVGETKLEIDPKKVTRISDGLFTHFWRLNPDSNPGWNIGTITGLPQGTRVISVWMTEWANNDTSVSRGATVTTASVQLDNNGTTCRVKYNLDWTTHLPCAAMIIYGF